MASTTQQTPPDCLPGEEWRDVANAPGYQVSDLGRVGSFRTTKPVGGRRKTRRILKPATMRTGHKSVHIKINGRYKTRPVHQLVLEAFVGPKPPGMESRHLDNDAGNNRRPNLEWATHQVNMADQAAFGTRCIGSRKPAAKLRERDIPEIYRMFAEGRTWERIALHFDVSLGAIRQVIKGITWKHVPRPPLVRPEGMRDRWGRPIRHRTSTAECA